MICLVWVCIRGFHLSSLEFFIDQSSACGGRAAKFGAPSAQKWLWGAILKHLTFLRNIVNRKCLEIQCNETLENGIQGYFSVPYAPKNCWYLNHKMFYHLCGGLMGRIRVVGFRTEVMFWVATFSVHENSLCSVSNRKKHAIKQKYLAEEVMF